MSKLLKNRYVQLASTFALGITIGVLFYPSKSIEERTKEETIRAYTAKITELKESHAEEKSRLLEQHEEEQRSNKEYKEETARKLISLTTENRKLKQKTKENYYKLIKPDGTIIEKRLTESDVEETTEIVTQVREEFTRKIASIENRYRKAYTKRLKEIKKTFDEKLAKEKEEKQVITIVKEIEKIVKVNAKQGGIDVGLTNKLDVYVNTSYDIWGPVYINTHINVDKTKTKYKFGIGMGIRF